MLATSRASLSFFGIFGAAKDRSLSRMEVVFGRRRFAKESRRYFEEQRATRNRLTNAARSSPADCPTDRGLPKTLGAVGIIFRWCHKGQHGPLRFVEVGKRSEQAMGGGYSSWSFSFVGHERQIDRMTLTRAHGGFSDLGWEGGHHSGKRIGEFAKPNKRHAVAQTSLTRSFRFLGPANDGLFPQIEVDFGSRSYATASSRYVDENALTRNDLNEAGFEGFF
jgi:hypothetical protein